MTKKVAMSGNVSGIDRGVVGVGLDGGSSYSCGGGSGGGGRSGGGGGTDRGGNSDIKSGVGGVGAVAFAIVGLRKCLVGK